MILSKGIFNFLHILHSVERELIERHTFDPTHILTNMHAHICKKGFQHVRAEAFLEVSERNNYHLSRALLTEGADKQNLEEALHICRATAVLG